MRHLIPLEFMTTKTGSNGWLRNTRDGYNMPIEAASSPPPEVTRNVTELDEMSAIRSTISGASDQASRRACEHQAAPSKPQLRSFDEVRRWLLDQPNWVGAQKWTKGLVGPPTTEASRRSSLSKACAHIGQ